MADFQTRTLDRLRGYFSRLIYLASLRDYNTGCYHHAGLESRYDSAVVNDALHRCHTEVFEELAGLPLRTQTDDLVSFFVSLKEERARLVDAWERLRSYQVLPSENCHPLARDLFEKNVELILKVLRQTELWELLHDPHSDPHDLT